MQKIEHFIFNYFVSADFENLSFNVQIQFYPNLQAFFKQKLHNEEQNLLIFVLALKRNEYFKI